MKFWGQQSTLNNYQKRRYYQVLTQSSLSKSLGNLDESGRSPEEMLKESYSKLYNTKIKRFMKDDPSGADEECVDGKVTTEPTSSTVSLKHDAKLPRLGVDFGLLKSRNLSTDGDCDSQSDARELTDSNLNLPPLGLSSNGFTLPGAEAPR
ncbi:uncharacterized protein LOC121638581 isoform X2 [Melanotaenia boesemani]|uniref:uncharacterized protein LOC121638581 isoform X2 n=1 Tax=Melanotaenia boesemani TaxID=1250792 RepID=UPI001C05DA87|nr:uncharacterized protein LOC121638581 isoform X2 [Melanotaenia boesemani]